MRNPSLRVYRPFVDSNVPHYHVALVRDESTPYESATINISGPEDVAHVCADLRAADRERFEVLLLTTKNNLIARVLVSIGSLNASIVHPREVLKPAVVANAASIVLVHNHPSGDSTPSGADTQLCRRLVKAADHVGIEILDSVVIGGGDDGSVCSMRDVGLL
ncbi:MAG: JAB domain-containing protein [Coriobacteriia bacterium]|nr:JAB domain-containing protein [Coriobacteriia bacterium]